MASRAPIWSWYAPNLPPSTNAAPLASSAPTQDHVSVSDSRTLNDRVLPEPESEAMGEIKKQLSAYLAGAPPKPSAKMDNGKNKDDGELVRVFHLPVPDELLNTKLRLSVPLPYLAIEPLTPSDPWLVLNPLKVDFQYSTQQTYSRPNGTYDVYHSCAFVEIEGVKRVVLRCYRFYDDIYASPTRLSALSRSQRRALPPIESPEAGKHDITIDRVGRVFDVCGKRMISGEVSGSDKVWLAKRKITEVFDKVEKFGSLLVSSKKGLGKGDGSGGGGGGKKGDRLRVVNGGEGGRHVGSCVGGGSKGKAEDGENEGEEGSVDWDEEEERLRMGIKEPCLCAFYEDYYDLEEGGREEKYPNVAYGWGIDWKEGRRSAKTARLLYGDRPCASKLYKLSSFETSEEGDAQRATSVKGGRMKLESSEGSDGVKGVASFETIDGSEIKGGGFGKGFDEDGESLVPLLRGMRLGERKGEMWVDGKKEKKKKVEEENKIDGATLLGDVEEHYF